MSENVTQTAKYKVLLDKQHKILLEHFNIVFSVSVYVMLHQKSPHVLCVTQRLRNTELVDPSFQWHGPKGKLVSGRVLL